MVTIPNAPSALAAEQVRKFRDCKYVYVRFEDLTTVAEMTPASVKKMMRGLAVAAHEQLNKRQPPTMAILASPWLAEQLYHSANCVLTGVGRDGEPHVDVLSRLYEMSPEAHNMYRNRR